MKNPLTLVGIEPATLRFVAQHLNHCATAVPHNLWHLLLLLLRDVAVVGGGVSVIWVLGGYALAWDAPQSSAYPHHRKPPPTATSLNSNNNKYHMMRSHHCDITATIL